MAKVQGSPYKDDQELAEEQYVEDKAGEQIRAALYPLLEHLNDTHPEGYSRLIETELTGQEWISTFMEPIRFGWRGKRFSSDIVWQISELLYTLEQLSERTAALYQPEG